MELTLELGCVKYPRADELSEYWADNLEPLLKYMEQVSTITVQLRQANKCVVFRCTKV